MKHNQFSSDLAAKCLRLIKEQGPIFAIDLAGQLGIEGIRESKRRAVREIVDHLRKVGGNMIVADEINGYFLTDDITIWQNYLNGRQISAKKILGITHRQLNMVTDSKSQGLLFVPGVGRLDNSQFKGVD